MIRHLIKLNWNRKRTNFLMIAEIFFSFLVLFGVCTAVANFYNNYKKPIGFDYKNVWLMNAYAHETPDAEKRQRLEQMVQRIKALPEVEHVALGSDNGPYTRNTWTTTLSKGNIEIAANLVYAQHDAFKDVLKLNMVDGRWFEEGDASSNQNPVIITQDAKQKLFGDEPAVGKKIQIGKSDAEPEGTDQLVIGVVEAYKPGGELDSEAASYFVRTSLADTSEAAHAGVFIRVKDDTNPSFEEQLLKESASVAPGWTLNIRPLEDLRRVYLKEVLLPFIALFIICGFLILNVALGLFGVLWQSINKRYSEIGLRRALGASESSIYRQFLGEVLVLASFGLILGCFFAVQFPLLGVLDLPAQVYTLGIVIAVLLIYSLVILCALYPSRQAAAIHPATALHEE
ncbi:ABC transporter permease [Pontibacter sp. H259]|uniref:ABC transporter permease n=1 Tax=Pontibacter sp. H259 TaxID=3133421 RepID=UPI0030BB65D3